MHDEGEIFADYVSAAQATVAIRGLDAWLLLRVLAADGSAESADIMLPLVIKALAKKGEDLDFLVDLLDDRARASPAMKSMFEALFLPLALEGGVTNLIRALLAVRGLSERVA